MTDTATASTQHGWMAKLFHWGTAGLLAYGYATGVNDISELADPAIFQTEIIFATVLGLVFAIRFFWMHWVNGSTRLSPAAPRWERVSSKVVHCGIYAGVGLIVLSGLAIAYGYATPMLSGLFVSAMIGLHEFSLALTAVLMMVHVLGALWHKFVRKDAIWGSMLPNWRGATPARR